jgi:hypothetical protein
MSSSGKPPQEKDIKAQEYGLEIAKLTDSVNSKKKQFIIKKDAESLFNLLHEQKALRDTILKYVGKDMSIDNYYESQTSMINAHRKENEDTVDIFSDKEKQSLKLSWYKLFGNTPKRLDVDMQFLNHMKFYGDSSSSNSSAAAATPVYPTIAVRPEPPSNSSAAASYPTIAVRPEPPSNSSAAASYPTIAVRPGPRSNIPSNNLTDNENKTNVSGGRRRGHRKSRKTRKGKKGSKQSRRRV